jgi:hypothetical protein
MQFSWFMSLDHTKYKIYYVFASVINFFVLEVEKTDTLLDVEHLMRIGTVCLTAGY